MDRRAFELYLLSSMRAEGCVGEALGRMRASRQAMAEAREAAEAYGFLAQVHPARLYREVLGEPYSSTPDQTVADTHLFGGSIVWQFEVEPWPEFDYVVREHPAGYAWGMGMERREGLLAPALEGAADLLPWRFAASEIAARWGPPARIDAWSGWEDLGYRVPGSGGDGSGAACVLGFDLNLLQTVSFMK